LIDRLYGGVHSTVVSHTLYTQSLVPFPTPIAFVPAFASAFTSNIQHFVSNTHDFVCLQLLLQRLDFLPLVVLLLLELPPLLELQELLLLEELPPLLEVEELPPALHFFIFAL
jgi:hypothetical protein